MADDRDLALSRRRFVSASAIGLAALAAMARLAPPLAARRVLAASLQGAPLPSLSRHPLHRQRLVLGHDLSTLQQEEHAGRTFSDAGRVQPVERIVVRHGATYVRLRLWVDPPIPYDDLPHVLAMARRIKDAGLKLLLDFHYSDFWADAGKQTTPQRWQGQDLPMLAQTVHHYTRSVVAALAGQGTPADMVQIGNEVTAGMLWPQGKIYVDGAQRWDEFTTLLKAGIAGAREGGPHHQTPRVMVHIDRGGDNAGSRWFYDHILDRGVDFDVIGLSYYPWWHGPLSNLQSNLDDVGPRYGKDIVVVETAYPWTFANGDGYANIVGPGTALQTGYPATPHGQLSYLRAVLSIVLQTLGGHGLGVVYWEPAWIPGVGWKPGAGDAWDNLTLFDFHGRALSSSACFERLTGQAHP